MLVDMTCMFLFLSILMSCYGSKANMVMNQAYYGVACCCRDVGEGEGSVEWDADFGVSTCGREGGWSAGDGG